MNHYRHMEIFVAIVTAGQFNRAAETLGLSKSAVSHAMNELEKHLGLQLINRTSRTLHMTDAGQIYYDESVRILFDIEQLESRVKDSDKMISGRIRLSAPAAYLSLHLSPIIAEFTRLNPAVTIEFVLAERVLDLVDDGIDFAVRIGDLKDSRLVARKISEFEHYVCAAPAYLKTCPPIKTHDDLQQANCMKFTRTPIWHLTRDSLEHHITPKGNIVSNNGDALREMAISGQGVAFLPEFLAREGLADGRLVRVLSDYRSRVLSVSIVRPPTQHVPARVRNLIDFIVARMTSAPL